MVALGLGDFMTNCFPEGGRRAFSAGRSGCRSPSRASRGPRRLTRACLAGMPARRSWTRSWPASPPSLRAASGSTPSETWKPVEILLMISAQNFRLSYTLPFLSTFLSKLTQPSLLIMFPSMSMCTFAFKVPPFPLSDGVIHGIPQIGGYNLTVGQIGVMSGQMVIQSKFEYKDIT